LVPSRPPDKDKVMVHHMIRQARLLTRLDHPLINHHHLLVVLLTTAPG
jgi:hypothetical protein